MTSVVEGDVVDEGLDGRITISLSAIEIPRSPSDLTGKC